MSNSLIREVIQKYVKLYQGGKGLVVRWDKDSQEIMVVPNGWKIFFWFFNLGVLVFTVSIIFYITVRELFAKDIKIPLWIILFNIICGFIGLMIASGAIGIIVFKENIVISWNQLLRVIRCKKAEKLGKILKSLLFSKYRKYFIMLNSYSNLAIKSGIQIPSMTKKAVE